MGHYEISPHFQNLRLFEGFGSELGSFSSSSRKSNVESVLLPLLADEPSWAGLLVVSQSGDT